MSDQPQTKEQLEVNNLKVNFTTNYGIVPAVSNVSFVLKPSGTLGVVGESGSGKTVTALSIMRLIPKPGNIANGQIIFAGKDILRISTSDMRKIRGNKISMIFQEPMTSLNPVHTIGFQISEGIRIHQKITNREAMEKAIEVLETVKIPSPKQRAKEFPHQISGGMRQRVMIGMALACNPKILIADEPTTALDVTIQAQILDLIEQIKQERKMATLIITHDLGVVSQMTEYVIVMYAGSVMEYSYTRDLFNAPLHPYTEGLLNSIPRLNTAKKRLNIIEGTVPDLYNLPSGCRFYPRCHRKIKICHEKEPPLMNIDGRKVRCWLYVRDEGGLLHGVGQI